MEKKKRTAYSLEFKRKLLEEIDNGVKKSKLCKQHKLSSSTLSTFISQRESIMKASISSGVNLKRQKMISAKFPDVEEALYAWFKQVQNQNIPISVPIFREKALNFASQFGHDEFQASDGWLSRFRTRFNIPFKIISGEKKSVPVENLNQWKQSKIQSLIKEFKAEDIYNADETGLFYKLTPAKCMIFKDEDCKGGKLSKERITILLCTNATGTDLVKPLVIGKSKNPKCFKNYRLLSSCCDYKNNPKAWMNSEIFNEWISKLDKRIGEEGRKILLFIDNCTTHNGTPKLDNINLQFFPANCNSVIQPLDAGIIKVFKGIYRKRLVQKIWLNILQKKEFKIDLRQSIEIASGSWRSVSQETVQNCWAHTRILNLSNNLEPAKEIQETINYYEDSATVIWEALPSRWNPSGISFIDFVSVDDKVLTCDFLTDEEIVQMVKNPLNIETDEVEITLEENSESTLNRITVSESLDFFEKLHVMVEGMSNVPDEIFKIHDQYKQFLLSRAITECTQRKISDYMM